MTVRDSRGRMRTGIALVLLLGALVPGSAYAERTIALNTGTVELALAPGGRAAETIRVANNGDEPLKALLYTSDVRYDEQGQPTYVKPTGEAGEFLRSPASWMSLRAPDATKIIANTPYIELDPGQEIEIGFEMTVPANATPGDYNSIIFFEMFDAADPETGTTSRISGRIGARIVLRVIGDIVDEIDVAPFSVRGFVIGNVVPYSFRVTNEGNIDKRYVPDLVVLDGNESERMRSTVETSAVVYAQNQREYVGGLKLENAGFGRFTMRVEVNYDKETGAEAGTVIPERVRKDRTFWVIPLWFAVAAIGVVGFPAMWLSWRASVKSAARKDEKRESAREERRQRLADRRQTSYEDEVEGSRSVHDDDAEE